MSHSQIQDVDNLPHLSPHRASTVTPPTTACILNFATCYEDWHVSMKIGNWSKRHLIRANSINMLQHHTHLLVIDQKYSRVSVYQFNYKIVKCFFHGEYYLLTSTWSHELHFFQLFRLSIYAIGNLWKISKLYIYNCIK